MSEEVALVQKKPPLVATVGLTKSYALRRGLLGRPRELAHALVGVSLEVRHGETLGVVGESGSGKSTLGKTLLRLVEPTLGRIVFDGTDITTLRQRELRPHRRRMQIVFQDPSSSLNPRMTVREIVGEGLELFELAKGSGLEDRTVSMLARVGLDPETLDRFPHELSGGQRQRVSIARALAVEPDFVVCDEPVSALDVSVQAQVLNLLEELQDASRVAYLFISHDLRVVEYTSHRVAVMYAGRIVETGPTAEVVGRRLHPYTRALFDASPRLPGAGGRAPRRLALAGEPPSATAPPPGCAFHPRCPRAERGKCDVEVPELRGVRESPAHRVACFHPSD